MITSHQTGHLIAHEDNEWVYADDKTTAQIARPCTKCKLPPTKEGYDPCLGHIEGAIHACCGHGIKDGYIMWANGKTEKINLKEVK